MPSKKKSAAQRKSSKAAVQPKGPESIAIQSNNRNVPWGTYASQVVLQLGFIAFSLFLLPNASSAGDRRIIAPSLGPLLDDPRGTLLLACPAVLLVQGWFGRQLRTWRILASQRQEKEQRDQKETSLSFEVYSSSFPPASIFCLI
jgi:hypothetical protein